MSSSSWTAQAAGLSQEDLLLKDQVILIDEILGGASKYDSHVFSDGQPHGMLHRAFSVFLFDMETKSMLLQQRASHKITFPNVSSRRESRVRNNYDDGVDNAVVYER
jgi:hypothetical protein